MEENKDMVTPGAVDASDNLVYLHDEDGNEIEFEFVDQIKYENEEYVVLLPTHDDSEEALTILKLESTDEDETEHYATVTDANTLDAVFEIFKEKFKDVYEFV